MRASDELLTDLLQSVSRSFYLTLRVLPDGVRKPIGLAYLLARAADTIADTSLLPPARRLQFLLSFREQVQGEIDVHALRHIEAALTLHQMDSSERNLLQSLGPALELLSTLQPDDRASVRHVVNVLTQGMELDLRAFPRENSGRVSALQTPSELDRYTYLVAGCVGEFWTQMTMRHVPALRIWDEAAMSQCGIRFGKALQYTNVLRDCAKDLRIGRCYIPWTLLQDRALDLDDLLKPESSVRARPLLFQLMRAAMEHYREAIRYTLAIPPQCGRLRLACLWPVLIGLETLALLAQNEAWLDPAQPSKIPRNRVYLLIGLSLPVAGTQIILSHWLDEKMRAVESLIRDHAD